MTENKITPDALAGATGEHETKAEQEKILLFEVRGSKEDSPALPLMPETLPWPSSFKLGPDGVYKMEAKEGEDPVDIPVHGSGFLFFVTAD